jgi:predicted TIM-barrel fold metal-dependent hydrolase
MKDLNHSVIDAHHHFIPKAILDDLERFLPAGYTVHADGERRHIYRGDIRQLSVDAAHYADPERQLRDMDDAGVDTAVLSAAVFQEWMSLDAARVFNRELGDLQRRYPGRFVGLAHVPPFGSSAAIDELERAVREDELKGVCITTSYQGLYPDAPEYADFYAKVNELCVPIFVHAAGCPVDVDILGPYALGNTLGRGFDHAFVTARVLYAGVLETYPNLTFLMGHLGGAFYGMTKRLLDEAPARPGNRIPQRPYREQLRRIWFDTAPAFWQTPAEITHAIASYGIDRVCFGSDYPAGPTDDSMREAVAIVDALQLAPTDLGRIRSLNAAELFGLKG